MGERFKWFLIGAAVATVFWLVILNGLGQQWLDALIK